MTATNGWYRLKRYRAQYEIAQNALKVAGHLLPTLGNSEADQGDRIWLNLLEAIGRKSSYKFGKAAQARIELLIATLEFEVANAEQRMAQLG